MGYQFKGFFAAYSAGLAEAVTKQWPTATVREFRSPFDGPGLRLPEAESRVDMETLYAFPDELLSWSRSFSSITFVYVYADCFGSRCDYSGRVCKDGMVLTVEEGDEALSSLLRDMVIVLGENEYFEPFTRSYGW